MKNSYVIQWKSKVNGRAGRGTKTFHREDAEHLATELNLEYPQIVHEAVKFEPRAQSEAELLAEDSALASVE